DAALHFPHTQILRHHLVRRQQRQPLNLRLRHEQAIERVLVERRQRQNSGRVFSRYCEFAPTIAKQAISQRRGINLEIGEALRALDRDFPYARGAEPNIRSCIVDQ
ncbi:MAG TPA: hypothetical protein VEA63_10125, partial [Opitutus sp.]|nr:hypothetical protein [Opitutus sp.]